MLYDEHIDKSLPNQVTKVIGEAFQICTAGAIDVRMKSPGIARGLCEEAEQFFEELIRDDGSGF